MLAENKIAPPFSDDRNITVGMARIIYAPKVYAGPPEGFVLPGGRRTDDRFEAHAYAVRMNDFIYQHMSETHNLQWGV